MVNNWQNLVNVDCECTLLNQVTYWKMVYIVIIIFSVFKSLKIKKSTMANPQQICCHILPVTVLCISVGSIPHGLETRVIIKISTWPILATQEPLTAFHGIKRKKFQYWLSHIDALRINLSYWPKDQSCSISRKNIQNWWFWKT